MKNAGALYYEKMSDQAKAAVDMTMLHYRGALAEAILKGKPPSDPEPPKEFREFIRKKDRKPANSVAKMMTKLGDLDRRKRRRLVRLLMSEDIGTHKMTARDRRQLAKWVEPDSKRDFWLRVPMHKLYAEIYKHPPKEELEEPEVLGAWTYGVIGGFLPGISAEDDGRPDDSEPGTPEPDTPTPTPTPQPPFPPITTTPQFLHFNVERIRCQRTTRGEWGDDEIGYGAVAVEGPMASFANPNDAGGVLTDRFDAGTYDDGISRNMMAQGPLHSFNLADANYPHLFVIHFVMAELDSPGVGYGESLLGFMMALQDDIMAEVDNYWALFGLAIAGSTAAGMFAGAQAGPIGALIGGLAGAIYASIFALVGIGNSDDIFDVETYWIELQPNPRNSPPFNGSTVTPSIDTTLIGDGGAYHLTYHWELEGFSTFASTVGDQDP